VSVKIKRTAPSSSMTLLPYDLRPGHEPVFPGSTASEGLWSSRFWPDPLDYAGRRSWWRQAAPQA